MKLPTVCALDCPDTCSLLCTVENGRLTKVEGNREHEITSGFACVKLARYPERQHHLDRLLYPQRRIGRKGEGKFTRISWDEAFDEIADRMTTIIAKHGSQSILPYHYAGTMGMMQGNHVLTLFRALGTLELDQTICAATAGTAWEANYGPNKLSVDPVDVIHARCIVLWGINVLRSNSHLVPFLKEARRRGAKIYHVDPYRNETSRFADVHLQVRVGSDTALALCIANMIFDNKWIDEAYLNSYASGINEFRQACAEWPVDRAAKLTGLTPLQIQDLARDFATSNVSFLKVGYGMSRNAGGGNAVRAISLLPALIGAWKQQGGGGALSTSGAFPFNRTICGGLHLRRPNIRHVNMNLLASELTSSAAIQCLFVFNSNPAAVAPNSHGVRKGLARDDLFTVVLEHFQTDTADYADLLLPATNFLEHPDLYYAYGHYNLQWADPIMPAPGECRPNTWMLSEIGKRLGINEPTLYWSAEELTQSLLDTKHPFLQNVTLERLKRERSVKLQLPQPFLPYADGSNFPDRKIQFAPAPEQVDALSDQPSGYPLKLISPPGPYIINTSMGNIESLIKLSGGQPRVLLHPADASSRSIADLQMVRIRSNMGEIMRQCLVTPDTLPGTVIALGQWWPKLAPDRRSLNDLTDERLTDLGGGSMFGDVNVEVHRVE